MWQVFVSTDLGREGCDFPKLQSYLPLQSKHKFLPPVRTLSFIVFSLSCTLRLTVVLQDHTTGVT